MSVADTTSPGVVWKCRCGLILAVFLSRGYVLVNEVALEGYADLPHERRCVCPVCGRVNVWESKKSPP